MTVRAVLLLAFPGLALGQGLIAGTVSSDSARKHPLAGIEVAIPAIHTSTRTDSTGFYHIDGVVAGHYAITVRAVGYQPRIDTANVVGTDATMHDFVLSALAQPLDTVVSTSNRRGPLSPAMRGFEERKKAGFGHFLGEDVLRQHDNDKLSDVARRLPGAKTVRSGTHTYLASTRKSGLSATSTSGCFATVYVDGMEIYTASRASKSKGAQLPPPDLQDFNVNELGAVEYYGGEATAPPGFHQDGCGLLLIWSREH